jgi:hypothetical protein
LAKNELSLGYNICDAEKGVSEEAESEKIHGKDRSK